MKTKHSRNKLRTHDYLKDATRDPDTIIAMALRYQLNPQLAIKQKLSTSNLVRLNEMHKKMNTLVAEANEKDIHIENERVALLLILSEIMELEFAMQREWGYLADPLRHRHFKRVKHYEVHEQISENAKKQLIQLMLLPEETKT